MTKSLISKLYLKYRWYSSFRDTILYSGDTLTIDDVYDTLLSKEKMKYLVGAAFRDEEALVSHDDRWRGRSG